MEVYEVSLRKIIGENIHKFRKETDITQEKLGEKINVDQGMISRIENYKENIRIDTFAKLCKSLSIHPYEAVIAEDEITCRDLLIKSIFQKGVLELLKRYFLSLTQKLNTEISQKPYAAYGIDVKDAAEASIGDISSDRAFVESIIALCNELELDPSQLLNVVEDSLLNI